MRFESNITKFLVFTAFCLSCMHAANANSASSSDQLISLRPAKHREIISNIPSDILNERWKGDAVKEQKVEEKRIARTGQQSCEQQRMHYHRQYEVTGQQEAAYPEPGVKFPSYLFVFTPLLNICVIQKEMTSVLQLLSLVLQSWSAGLSHQLASEIHDRSTEWSFNSGFQQDTMESSFTGRCPTRSWRVRDHRLEGSSLRSKEEEHQT